MKVRRFVSQTGLLLIGVILPILVNESPSETMRQSPADRAYWEGTLAYKRGDYKEADVCFRRAILEDSSNAQFRIDDAMANIALGNRAEAEKQLRWIVDQEGEGTTHGCIQSHKYLGILYRQKEDLPGAEDQFRAAIALAPRKIDARLLLARLLIQGDHLESAEQELSRLLEIDPADKDALRLLERLEREESQTTQP